MDSRRMLSIILVLATIGIGLTAATMITLNPIDSGTTDETTTTDTTDETETTNEVQLIFRDLDLLDYNITVPDDWLFIMLDNANETGETLKGKFTVIDFFATWCPACEVFNMDMQRMADEYGDTINLMSITVSIGDYIVQEPDTPDSYYFDKLQDYIDERELTWRFGIDWGQYADEFLGIRYIPTAVVIDDVGRVRWMHEGVWRFTEMNATVFNMMQ